MPGTVLESVRGTTQRISNANSDKKHHYKKVTQTIVTIKQITEKDVVNYLKIYTSHHLVQSIPPPPNTVIISIISTMTHLTTLR